MTDVPDPLKSNELAAGLQRRRALLLGAGLVASLAGGGLAWWRNHGAAGGERVDALVPGFWSLAWEQPQGGQLKASVFQGQPLLINFWATWCPPCVEELPLINGFFKENRAKGFQVLAIAVDRIQAVQSFLRANPLDFPVAVAGMAGSDLATSLGDAAGSLPYSVFISADGRLMQRKLGRLSPEDLSQWLGLK